MLTCCFDHIGRHHSHDLGSRRNNASLKDRVEESNMTGILVPLGLTHESYDWGVIFKAIFEWDWGSESVTGPLSGIRRQS